MWTGEDTLDVAQGAETALSRNFLLRSLPRRDLERLSPFLEKVTLTPRRVLQHAGVPIEHLYFVEDGTRIGAGQRRRAECGRGAADRP